MVYLASLWLVTYIRFESSQHIVPLFSFQFRNDYGEIRDSIQSTTFLFVKVKLDYLA